MAGEPITTIIGNLTSDVDLRFTPSGAAVANFTIASNPRNYNKETQSWDEGEALFMRCSVWREYAENVAESLAKGMRVMVHGKLVSRSWEDKESGAKRTVVEMQVDEVGPVLRYATARVTKAERQGGNQQGGQQQGQGGGWGGQQQQGGGWGGQQPQGPPQGQQQDPWQQPQGQGWGQDQGQPPPWATQDGGQQQRPTNDTAPPY